MRAFDLYYDIVVRADCLARCDCEAAFACLRFSSSEIHQQIFWAVNGKALGQEPFDVEMHLVV